MFRTIAILGAGCFLTLGALGREREPAGATPPAVKGQFCPECWEFRMEAGSLEAEGYCRRCGKMPVGAEVCTMRWYGCAFRDAWHRQPCKPARGCCVPRESTAFFLLAGQEDVYKEPYCPRCRKFWNAQDEREKGKCGACGKPIVTAEAVARTWYWCESESAWLDQPCCMDRAAKCCSPRSGAILAYVFRPPIMLAVAGPRPPVRLEMLVTTRWVESQLDNESVVILHVGFDPQGPGAAGRSTYEQGHLPWARTVDWSEIAVTRSGLPNELPAVESLVGWVRRLGIDFNNRVVLYDTGAGLEAARAYLALDYLGLGANAALMDGHWRKWVSECRPVSEAVYRFEPSSFVPKLRPEVVIGLAAMRDFVWVANQPFPSVSLIDARSEVEFLGLSAGKGVKRPGHIRGAMNIFWMRNVVSKEEPVLCPEGDLRALYEGAGARPGRVVVAYCRTGGQASHTYFTAKYLGYEVHLYDGSFVEWSALDELPVEAEWSLR